MKTKIFQVEKYQNCPIYFRNLNKHFEYLTVINNEIYTAHLEIRPTALNKILFLLKLQPDRYSDQQYQRILKILRRMAQSTIETILENK
jgi:hypothetical protein